MDVVQGRITQRFDELFSADATEFCCCILHYCYWELLLLMLLAISLFRRSTEYLLI